MSIHPIRRPSRDTEFQAFRTAFPDFVAWTRRMRRLRDIEFGRLGTLPRRAQHGRVRGLLRWRGLHTLYAYEALRKARRLRTSTVADIVALASRCNPFTPSDEPVTAMPVVKRGQPRLVASFGPLKRMHQLLVADVLRALHPPLANQFMFRGGMPAAFRAVEAAHREGFTYGAEADITAFYATVRQTGLADILRPLSEHVVDHVVWDRASRPADTSNGITWASPSLNHQLGLALGAASSPIVAECIIARLIAPDDQCRAITYADNILVVGRSEAAVVAYFESLRERATTLAGWGLRLRSDPVRTLASGFEFLHHEASLDGGRFIWAPDQRKLDDFVGADRETNLSSEEIEAVEAKVSQWRRAYPDWPEGDVMEATQLAIIAARRFYNDASPINKSRAAHALIAGYLSNGRYLSLNELAPTGVFGRDDHRREELINSTLDRIETMMRRSGAATAEAFRYLG